MSKILQNTPEKVSVRFNDEEFLEDADCPKPYVLQNNNVFQFLYKLIQIAFKLSPAVLGIFDGVTDITYYLTQPFAHSSIQKVFYATLLFTPIALAITWDFQFSKQMYENRDKTEYNRRYQIYYSYQSEVRNVKQNSRKECKKSNKKIFQLEMKSFFCLAQIYTYDFFLLHVYMVQVSLRAIMYAFLQETKLLPFIIGFFDPTLRKVKFPITKPLVAEFQARNHLFKQQTDIKMKNSKIISHNSQSEHFNEKQREILSDIRKPTKLLLPLPQIYRTAPLQAAQIMNSAKSWNNTLLTDPYVSNFLEISQLIKAVFQSLPMLIIQYINNSQLGIWDGNLNIISFSVSLLMVLVSSIQMIYSLSRSETLPLMEFKSYLQQDMSERSKDPLWLLQPNMTEEFYIYDMETLKIAAFANQDFYKSTKGIRFDISSDPDFILKCLEGPNYPFECLSNIILNMNSENQFHMHISDNKEITLEHIKIIFDALCFAKLKKISIEAKSLNLNYEDLDKLAQKLISRCDQKKIQIRFISDKIQFDNLNNTDIQLYLDDSGSFQPSDGRQLYKFSAASEDKQLYRRSGASEGRHYNKQSVASEGRQYYKQSAAEKNQTETCNCSLNICGHNLQKQEQIVQQQSDISPSLQFYNDKYNHEDEDQRKLKTDGQISHINSQSFESRTQKSYDMIQQKSSFMRRENSVIIEQDENDIANNLKFNKPGNLFKDLSDLQQANQSLNKPYFVEIQTLNSISEENVLINQTSSPSNKYKK